MKHATHLLLLSVSVLNGSSATLRSGLFLNVTSPKHLVLTRRTSYAYKSSSCGNKAPCAATCQFVCERPLLGNYLQTKRPVDKVQVHVVQSQVTERLLAGVNHNLWAVVSVPQLQHTNGINPANDVARRSKFCAAALV